VDHERRRAARQPLSAIPGIAFPPPQLAAYHLDFGPRWGQGIVDNEPPRIGAPFVVRVPAVDADGNDRAGIRVPDIVVPLGTYFGWNYRSNAIGAPRHLNGEDGSYIPLQLTRAKRLASGDPRLSIEERYASKAEYLEKVRAATNALVADRFLLAEDASLMLKHASYSWDWARTSVDPLYWWAAAVGVVVLSLIAGLVYAVWRTLRWLWRRLFTSVRQAPQRA
jgi:alpha/beta hydrolase family protein